mgnify:FL=1
MGKLLVKFGTWVSKIWCKYCCFHNSIVAKLIFKVESCPNQMCACKK